MISAGYVCLGVEAIATNSLLDDLNLYVLCMTVGTGLEELKARFKNNVFRFTVRKSVRPLNGKKYEVKNWLKPTKTVFQTMNLPVRRETLPGH